ncbi:MAG: hypothetical protein WAV90_19255 [Gordonia amarae]
MSNHSYSNANDTSGEVTVDECRQGGGEVEYTPGGYPRHCRGGEHDGKPLKYGS